MPIRLHFGVIGLAPAEADIVDSVPPSYFGGNCDWAAAQAIDSAASKALKKRRSSREYYESFLKQ
ncbi:MAG: hypothetical protein AAGD09_13085 [Cyanobacteria bacterium P01_F01_bin.56]